jgi:hypothetical protein
MPRKKKAAPEAAQTSTATAAAVKEPMTGPAWIDGPPVDEQGQVIKGNFEKPDDQMQLNPESERPEGRNWGDPYKALVTTPTFEMGENRRFRQRVFKFKEKPSDEILAALKENGFTYRANEKAWTVQATPDTRRLSDELAQEFGGQVAGMSR